MTAEGCKDPLVYCDDVANFDSQMLAVFAIHVMMVVTFTTVSSLCLFITSFFDDDSDSGDYGYWCV